MRARHARALSATSAVLLSLAVAGQASAAVWRGPVTVAAAGAAAGMATMGASTAVALFHDNAGLHVKRSTDSGATWDSQRTLTHSVGCDDPSATIAGAGRNVDVAWIEFPECGTGSIVYRRSTDRARTFGPPVVIATESSDLFEGVSVARGPNNVVAILWTSSICANADCDELETSYRIRVSIDGGLSFDERKTVASTRNQVSGGSALAIGDGAIYVAYVRNDGFVRDSEIRLRRSLDGGSTWSTPHSVAKGVVFDDASGPFEIVASGSRAAIAYLKWKAPGEHLLVRHTANWGVSWSAPVAVSAVDRRSVWSQRLTWQGGTLRIAFTRCPLVKDDFGDWVCTGSRLIYQASADGGATWTPPQVVTENDSPAAIGFAGQVLLLLNSGTFDPVLLMRGAAT